MVRRQMAEGRTLSDMVVAWKRQEQYDFWPAWIKECFRFPSTRLIAEHRWQAMNRFMGDLEQVCQPMAPAEAAKTVPQTGGRLLGKGL